MREMFFVAMQQEHFAHRVRSYAVTLQRRFADMWYFSWILGLGLACAFAILNAMWYEVHATDEAHRQRDDFELPDELT